MREEGACIVHVDTKTTNKDMIVFLESQGYKVIRVDDLYDSGKPDIVLGKQLASVV
jgi:aerobic-type carbon monoxide dehydrogenase small subunit (CoxS/CutS family)